MADTQAGAGQRGLRAMHEPSARGPQPRSAAAAVLGARRAGPGPCMRGDHPTGGRKARELWHSRTLGRPIPVPMRPVKTHPLSNATADRMPVPDDASRYGPTCGIFQSPPSGAVAGHRNGTGLATGVAFDPPWVFPSRIRPAMGPTHPLSNATDERNCRSTSGRVGAAASHIGPAVPFRRSRVAATAVQEGLGPPTASPSGAALASSTTNVAAPRDRTAPTRGASLRSPRCRH